MFMSRLPYTSIFKPSCQFANKQPKLSLTRFRASVVRLYSTSPDLTRRATMATAASPQVFMHTSGTTEPVWIHTEPYDRRPQFPKLTQNVEADVCILGSGIAGISTAYELVSSGAKVIMLEAREVLSGESGRTSGHLSSSLDDGYIPISKKHGNDGAKLAAESHTWALRHVGEVARKLGIDCEYRTLPGYQISQYPRGDPKHDNEVSEMKEEAEKAKELGLPAMYKDRCAIKGKELPNAR